MHAHALQLYRFACSTQDPRGTIARWLAQELTLECCAVAILALYQLTGELWRHPQTPQPDTVQRATCPEVWFQAVELVQRHDPNALNVSIGDKLTGPGAGGGRLDAKLEKFLRQDPMQIDEGPAAVLVAGSWSAVNGIMRKPDDRKAPPRSAVGLRFQKPVRRGEGRTRVWSAR